MPTMLLQIILTQLGHGDQLKELKAYFLKRAKKIYDSNNINFIFHIIKLKFLIL